MTLPCPCCGQPVDGVRDPALVLDLIAFSAHQRAVLDYLADRIGRWVRSASLAEAVYGLRPDGGPLNSENSLSVTVHHIRKKLADTPLALETAWSEGRSTHGTGGRRLVWREAA